MQYTKIAEGNPVYNYLVRLETGEELVGTFARFCDDQRIDTAAVAGIGTVHGAVLGYFDREGKQYVRRTVEGDCELVSLQGNVSLKEGKPYLHAHVVLGTRDFQALAGHLFEAKVAATCELVVRQLPGMVQRKKDEKSGLWLLDV